MLVNLILGGPFDQHIQGGRGETLLSLLEESWPLESIRNKWENFELVQTPASACVSWHYMLPATCCSLTCPCLFFRSLDMCIM